ncbi:MAG: SEFIR domain-containing protein [Thiofilum sp.]|uniref:toll/interleukin-1 receptor domain-containing protein n=1 Tax=Thiofilum sp. TaxID=2212733 RepID=UPI0025FE7979|nr:toll/interleukin-1 receptor domain-containing protein [Thiofilum sp.]MBK8454214.1 TIR domain-containing protein [Thiofilum sp.]
MQNQKPKVFISYSHDSLDHRDFVRRIADRLCQDGIDCRIDDYINGFPPEGWLRWMENQIETANFVLLMCTENYLRHYRGLETEGGKGVNFEGLVISQILYEHYYKNTKFIPVLPEQGDRNHIPISLRPYSNYCLPSQYEDVYRVLTGQAKYIQPKLGDIRELGSECPIFIDRLPTVAGGFFGRKEELQLLDNALLGDGTRIMQFIAAGGTGKTKLLRHWLNKQDAAITNRIIWSFYSQGSAEDKQVSASPFFVDAFNAFGIDYSQFKTEEEKADALVKLLVDSKTLLVLDGLEPLQYVGKGIDGRLKDRAITRLLQRLASQHSSLCIITTRIQVYELLDRNNVVSINLQNLTVEDSIRLLKAIGVRGGQAYQSENDQLKDAVKEYQCHALALHLLGNALCTYYDGDILKRNKIDELIGDYNVTEHHAFKVMAAYEKWLENTPELQLLYLLGSFDHPVEIEVLEVLWKAQIFNLTKDIPHKAWLNAIINLRERHHLLSIHEGYLNLIDCHPLIRQYFGKQLQKKQPDAWKKTHENLYFYYKNKLCTRQNH